MYSGARRGVQYWLAVHQGEGNGWEFEEHHGYGHLLMQNTMSTHPS